jgi:hypothetical protein
MAGPVNARRLPGRPLYRTRQVLHALRPRLAETELALAREQLTPPQAELFFAMPRRDQRHALEVARRLQMQGITSADVRVAALLHDCGKGDVPVWLRVLYVLAAGLVKRCARAGGGWRGAAERLAGHEALSASAAAAAGCSERTVRLIRGRPNEDEAVLFAALLAADDAS